jgi:hypothetical protein
MAKVSEKKAKPAKVDQATEAKRAELNRLLYELSGDPAKAEEFEAVRLELEKLGGAS